ncbi:MAG: DUF4838 domain-containing protein [bacterium]|nr:DUF4838 domain-containing protein [bacterium]
MRSATASCLLALTLSWAACAGAAVPITENGEARAAIVVDEAAPDSVQHAAQELRDHVELVSGAQLEIRATPPGDPDISTIILGAHPAAEALGWNADGFGPDEFRIMTGKNCVAIFGTDYAGPPITGYRNPWQSNEVYNPELKLGAFGSCGTLHGVYRFLDTVCGVRWYMPGDLGVVAPHRATIEVPVMCVRVAPDFTYRYPWMCNFANSPDDALWYRRVGFGAPAPAQIIHSFNVFLGRHKDAHPEYFAIIDGERDFTNLSTAIWGGNLCLSNPDVATQWIADICAYFDANPQHDIFPVAPNDGMSRICDCAGCQAYLEDETVETGRFSNYVWTFVDKVAAGVAKQHPDKLVGCIAYERYHEPPTSMERLHPNVAVMVCKDRGMFFDEAYRTSVHESIEGWLAKADHLYCWEYYLYSWRPWRGLPVVYPHGIAEDLTYLRGKVPGEFIESESWQRGDDLPPRMNFPGMQHLNLYVTARLYWDSEQDVDALLERYYSEFYGPARQAMAEYWGLAESIWTGRKSRAEDPATVYTPERLALLTGHLEKARGRAPEDSVYRKRIDLIAEEFEAIRVSLSSDRVVEPPILLMPEPAPSIVVDGILDDEAWHTATPFDFVSKEGGPAVHGTEGAAAWDGERLYLAFTNEEPAPDKMHVNATERDQSFAPGMWDDESIEVFLAPDPDDRTKCYHFIMNAKGLVWDSAMGFSDSGGDDRAWNSTAEAAGVIGETSWTLEVAIPLADLGVEGLEHGTMALNLYRNRYCGAATVYTGWSPTLASGHFTPHRFGTVRF